MRKPKKSRARKPKKVARKHGWSGSRYERGLTAARNQARLVLGRAQLVVLEQRGLVVVKREMMVDLLAYLRSRDDLERANVAHARAYTTAQSSWA